TSPCSMPSTKCSQPRAAPRPGLAALRRWHRARRGGPHPRHLAALGGEPARRVPDQRTQVPGTEPIMTTTAHVSELQLDAFALGALDGPAETRVQAHLAVCTSCRSARTSAAALRAHFTVHVLPRGLRARPRPRRRWRWHWLAIPALAAALLVVVWRRPLDPTAGGDLAVKGTPSWQVFAHRAGQTFAVHDGAALAAGDRIRFAMLSGGARYLLIASIDGSGAATIYYPYDGAESAAIPGDRVEPAGSIVLDDAPGPERVFAILSDQPIAADVVKAQLRSIALGGPAAIRATRALALPARAQVSLVFEKAVP